MMTGKSYNNNKKMKQLINQINLGRIGIGLIMTGLLILNIFQWQKAKNTQTGVKVIGVIDGDTLVLDGKVRIRLRSIDAPELNLCGGEEAKELLENLVSKKDARIEEKIVDQMARPMALIYVDDTLINQKMLESGWARFHSDSTSQRENLKQAYEEARGKSLGIWSDQCRQTTNPDKPECKIKGNIDDNSRDRKLYYYPGCPQYEFTVIEKDMGEDWFCTKAEAEKAGYSKAKNCPQL